MGTSLRSTSPPQTGLAGLYFLAPYHTNQAEGSNPLRDTLLRFKYGGDRWSGRRLGKLFADAARPLHGSVDAVTSVPLHPRRLRRRGFNQACWLARPLASSLGVPWRPRLLRKLTDPPPQARCRSRLQRARSDAAFSASAILSVPSRVLLVDDVCTTGITLAACAAALRSRADCKVFAAVLLLVQSPGTAMRAL